MRKQFTISTFLCFLLPLVFFGVALANDYMPMGHPMCVVPVPANNFIYQEYQRQAVEQFHIVKGSVLAQSGTIGQAKAKATKKEADKVAHLKPHSVTPRLLPLQPMQEPEIKVTPPCPPTPAPSSPAVRNPAQAKANMADRIQRIKDLVAVAKEAKKRGLDDVAKRLDAQIEGEEKRVRALRERMAQAAEARKSETRRPPRPARMESGEEISAREQARLERAIKGLKEQIERLRKEVSRLKEEARETVKPESQARRRQDRD